MGLVCACCTHPWTHLILSIKKWFTRFGKGSKIFGLISKVRLLNRKNLIPLERDSTKSKSFACFHSLTVRKWGRRQICVSLGIKSSEWGEMFSVLWTQRSELNLLYFWSCMFKKRPTTQHSVSSNESITAPLMLFSHLKKTLMEHFTAHDDGQKLQIAPQGTTRCCAALLYLCVVWFTTQWISSDCK